MSYLFNYHINYQSNCQNSTQLPFQVFGMSQQGSSHERISIGNQDAGGVFIGKNLLIGVVADGCSGGKNIDGLSSNQVGAQIASNLSIKIIRRLIQRKKLNLENFKKEYEQSLYRQYKRLLNSFSPWKNERNIILSNLFTSTFVVFVVTQNYYMVFHCGDGDAFVNKKHFELSSDQGNYFSNSLLNQGIITKNAEEIPYIKYIKTGKTKELENILISTDGFIDIQIKRNNQFYKFFFEDKPLFNQTGFSDKKPAFRMKVLPSITKKSSHHDWPHDDATFISLTRVPKIKNNRL